MNNIRWGILALSICVAALFVFFLLPSTEKETPEETIGRKLLDCVNQGKVYSAVRGGDGKILFVCEEF